MILQSRVVPLILGKWVHNSTLAHLLQFDNHRRVPPKMLMQRYTAVVVAVHEQTTPTPLEHQQKLMIYIELMSFLSNIMQM